MVTRGAWETATSEAIEGAQTLAEGETHFFTTPSYQGSHLAVKINLM
jgi:hypothetical protein